MAIWLLNMTIEVSTESAIFIKDLVSGITSNDSHNWYEIIESLGIGIGTLLVGVGAISTLIPWATKKSEEYKIKRRIKSYKNKYSIEDIGKSFDLVWFNGKLILFDHENKKYHHIYPWETAEDLNFVSFGIHVKDSFPNPKENTVALGGNKKLNINDYTNGGSINTQNNSL